MKITYYSNITRNSVDNIYSNNQIKNLSIYFYNTTVHNM